jgi:DNA (cytosine-5)-methyltransferase 1
MINAVDLFCGGGGTSTGLWHAAQTMGRKINLVAINHWHIALNTHRENHPWAKHLWADLDSLNPREVLKDMPGKKLDLLVASPECIFHSNARGGKPIKEQLRASAWCVPRWIEAGQPNEVLLENVPEFRKWGPLDNKGARMQSRAGETYEAYINVIRSLGYSVEDKILCAADYGDPTSRTRLFIRAKKGNCKIIWPKSTYNENGDNNLKKWVAARDIIDWDLKGKSIFHRKTSLKPATLKRIEAGLKKFGGKNADPFLVMLYGSNSVRAIDRPMPTVTAGGNHIVLCEPFILPHPHGSDISAICRNTPPRSINRPLQTITGSSSNNIGLVEPFITIFKGQSCVRGVNEPLPTITTQPHLYLCEPFIVNYYGNSGATTVNNPLPTVTTKDRFGLVQPYQLDILFRMLQPHEIARATSFPDDYKFFGTKADIIKQIGNAVPIKTATALCETLIAA